MNIFFLSLDAETAAALHCDKHVVKMILETAQLLYSAHWIAETKYMPEDSYKRTHVNHPCSIWVRSSVSNYKWLCELGWQLCKEYQYRYGAHKTHKTEKHIVWLKQNCPQLPDVGFTTPPLAMPLQYKTADVEASYRRYYVYSKLMEKNIVTYTNRETPVFIKCHFEKSILSFFH